MAGAWRQRQRQDFAAEDPGRPVAGRTGGTGLARGARAGAVGRPPGGGQCRPDSPRELGVHGGPGGDEAGASATALEAVGLGAFSETRAGRLSEGQARRVALARLASSTRRLWLLDEPLTSLDETSVNWFETQVHRQLDRGGAIVMATHREISDSLQGWTLQLGA